jgi:hypothetical protein
VQTQAVAEAAAVVHKIALTTEELTVLTLLNQVGMELLTAKQIPQVVTQEQTLVLVAAVALTTVQTTMAVLAVQELLSSATKLELCPNGNFLYGGL